MVSDLSLKNVSTFCCINKFNALSNSIRIIKLRTIHRYIILLFLDIINLDKLISDLFYYIKLDVLYVVGCGDD